jgi:cell division protein FtsQ
MLLLTIIIISVVFAFNSEFFYVDYIFVEGNNSLSYDQIVNSSMIDIRENIFRIKLSDSRKKIEEMPYIRKAYVKRKLPNKIYITVEEREVAYQFKILSTIVLLDKEGYVLELTEEQVENIPLFSGFDLGEIELGKSIFVNNSNEELSVFFNDDIILNTLKNVSILNYDSLKDNVNIDLINGIGVAFGPLDNVKYKMKLLDKILMDIEKKQIQCKLIIMNKGDNPILVTDN